MQIVRSLAAVILAVLAVLLVAGVSIAASAGIIMLLLGAAHHEISPEIPALGFLATAIGVTLIGAIGALLRGNK